MKTRLLFSIVPALALLTACALPPAVAPRTDLLGEPVPPSAATRTIAITPATKWINVTGGDTVKFLVDDKEFAWSFNVARTVSFFSFKQIAPPGLLRRELVVYVAPDPRYYIHADWNSNTP
jgi:hypothetical protein